MPKLDKSHARIAKEIAKKYGSVIDLNKSPSLIIEIIRNYKYLFGADDDPPGMSSIAVAGPGTGGGTNTGGTGSGTGSGGTGSGGMGGGGGTGAGTSGPGTSSIAVAGPKQVGDGDIFMSNAAVMKAILALHRDVKAMAKTLAAKKSR